MSQPDYQIQKIGNVDVFVMEGETNAHDVALDLIDKMDKLHSEKSLFSANLDELIERHELWRSELPDVEVFYAVKAYTNPHVVKVLKNLGCSFEIASKGEAEVCIAQGSKPEELICNHPYKLEPHLKYYADNDIKMMSLDSPDELDKIAAVFPDAKLLVRIVPPSLKIDDGFHFDTKFGATEAQTRDLLQLGKGKGLDFIGVSFHLGATAIINDETAHRRAIEMSRRVFDFAESLGYNFNILDIGGGFPDDHDEFRKVCDDLRPALSEYFPTGMDVRVIAEPGTFFARAVVSVYARVIGRRQVARYKLEKAINRDKFTDAPSDPDDLNAYVYILNDGVFGSLNFIPWLNEYQPLPVLKPRSDVGTAPCTIWGPTLDPLDRITNIYSSQILEIGDWVYRKMCGAYSDALRSKFNCMPEPHYLYTIRRENLKFLE